MQIPVNFNPRTYQAEALRALDNGSTMNLWCWARRGGKDLTGFAYAIKKMVEAPINVVLVFPTQKQGYKSFWINIENDGFKTLDHIPKSLIASQTNSETSMIITLKNGSTFQVLGATDPDALRGANGKIYLFSEFVDIPSAALKVIRPIIAVNGGQIIIQSTPKIDGISGGTFKILFDRAKRLMKAGDRRQYASLIKATEYLTAEQLEELRQECIEEYGNDFFWRQEYMCDWGQVSSTNYYGGALTMAKKRGNIGRFPYDPAYPVFTTWDLGMSDMMAVGFWQYINKTARKIDYHETHDIAYEHTIDVVKNKPYNIMWNFLPHDGAVRDSDAIERVEKVRQLGLPNCSLLRRELKEEGIKRAIEATPKTEFNEATTDDFRRKLGLYKRKFNPNTGDYMGPDHNTNSHAADEHRYMYAAIDQEFDPDTGLFLYSPDLQVATYESEDINVAAQYNPGY